MKYCNTCGVGDHSLEDCPIMLEKILNKKLVNNLSCVPKSDVHSVKNLQVITRCGTRIDYDKDIIEPIKHIEKNDYPNSQNKNTYLKMLQTFLKKLLLMKIRNKPKITL